VVVGEELDRTAAHRGAGDVDPGQMVSRARQTKDDFLAVRGEADPAEVARRDPSLATASDMNHVEGLLAGSAFILERRHHRRVGRPGESGSFSDGVFSDGVHAHQAHRSLPEATS
jgi:hypothetical protein